MVSQIYISDSNVFDYDDVMLVPQHCTVTSRSEVDTTVKIGSTVFKSPVIPANMSTVVDEKTCEWLAANGYFYIMHRFEVDTLEFVRRMKSLNLPASISVGVKDADYITAYALSDAGLAPDYVTIDIAHGDAKPVIEMVKTLRRLFPEALIIAGNVATPEAAVRLIRAGALGIKAGIAPGSACLTGPNTGFGSRGWQLSAVRLIANAIIKEQARTPNKIYLIADGGIKLPGDIAKSLAFGADLVMLGGMLAGHDENPGELIETEDGQFKEFFGSASAEQKGEKKHVEGKRMLVPYRGSLADTLTELTQHLQSSVSYSGGKNLAALKKVPHVRIR